MDKKQFSLNHKKFVAKEKRKTFFVHFGRILLLVLILGIWEISANANWIDPFITSSPSRIVNEIISLAKTGSLFKHVSVTVYETILAFALSTIIGSAVAIILFLWTPARRILEPYLIILNSLPKIALGPLIIIWVGIGTSAIVTMGILICVVITIINLLNSYLEVSSEKIMLLKSMGANKFQILTKLIIPATLPNFMATLKINLGMAWVGVIMGEYLSSKAGLGYLLVYGGQVFQLNLVMAAIVLLCILSGVMYGIISIFERIIIKKR
ncbi:MAG: ABC transporter permease [Clostridia bacterium]|nr:ABC transporter permease [Clostridia bacterium]